MFFINETLEIKEIDLFVAKPNLDRDIIGHLKEAYGKRLLLKINNLSELEFTIPFKIEKNII